MILYISNLVSSRLPNTFLVRDPEVCAHIEMWSLTPYLCRSGTVCMLQDTSNHVTNRGMTENYLRSSVLVTAAKQSAKGLKRKTNQEERRKTTRSDCVVAWGQLLMILNINASQRNIKDKYQEKIWVCGRKKMETNMTQMKVNEDEDHFLNNTCTSQLGKGERSRKLEEVTHWGQSCCKNRSNYWKKRRDTDTEVLMINLDWERSHR